MCRRCGILVGTEVCRGKWDGFGVELMVGGVTRPRGGTVYCGLVRVKDYSFWFCLL
jgi:hypothetical protein